MQHLDYLRFMCGRSPPACLLPGTPAHALAQLPGGTTQQLDVEHPSGASSCVITLDAHGEVVRTAVLRTARKLFDGELFA
ncbi:hypothetical protein XGA_3415 [Xanthomonas hortorum ATCC 19865]|nr:hypothetical protein XGA_3415 [Xanthomonas hortorum ATCC 19865]